MLFEEWTIEGRQETLEEYEKDAKGKRILSKHPPSVKCLQHSGSSKHNLSPVKVTHLLSSES